MKSNIFIEPRYAFTCKAASARCGALTAAGFPADPWNGIEYRKRENGEYRKGRLDTCSVSKQSMDFQWNSGVRKDRILQKDCVFLRT